MKKQIVIMLAVLLFSTTIVEAGVWANFWGAVGTTVENYNTDMLATGDAINASLKEGKVLAAFDAYDKNIQIVGEHALANSKAVYKALKDIVLWIPNQIKKVWDKFVAILQKIRDQLAAMNQPGGLTGGSPSAPAAKASSVYNSPKASKGWMDSFDMSPIDNNDNADNTPVSNNESTISLGTNGTDLGDGWIKMFKNAPDFESKLETFTNYKGHTKTMSLYMNGLEKEHFKALDPNFTKITNECNHIEGLLLEELSESLEADGEKVNTLTKTLSAMSENEAKVVLGSLTKKVSRRSAMLQLSGNSSLAEAVNGFNKTATEKGLK